MPRPLIRPLGIQPIQPLASRGLLRSTDPIQQYLPGEQDMEVARAELEQEKDEPNFFFKLLQLPNRLLGGQMIQGFLEGAGEGGIAEGARKGFVNNPFFQILEGVGAGEVVGDVLEGFGLKEEGSVGLVEDTSFAKVREAWGWDEPNNQVARVAVDLLGELATSPLELMFTPFGYTSKGLAAVKAARAAKMVPLGVKAGQISPDLAKATEAGMRTMMAFKVPFTEMGFSAWTPKHLDVYSARLIQNTADFLNSSPLTAPLINLFKRGHVASSDKEVRHLGDQVVAKGDEAVFGLEAQLLPILSKLTKETPEAIKTNPDFGRLIVLMQEHGIDAVDEAADLANVLRSSSDEISIYDAYLSRIQEKLTSKINRQRNIHEQIADTAGIRTDGVAASEFNTGTGKRSALSQENMSVAESARQDYVDAYLPELFRRLKEADSDGALFSAAGDLARGLDALGERLKDLDGMEGLLNSALEGYFPRDLSPQLKKAIDAKASNFADGRSVTDMSTLEFNHFVMKHGTKMLGFRSIEDLNKNLTDETYWKIVKDIFPEEFVQGLKKKFGGEAQKVTEFFNTNPLHAWYTRIQNSARRRQAKAMMSHLFEEDSPVVLRTLTLGEIIEDPTRHLSEMMANGEVGVSISGTGNSVFFRNISTGEMVEMSGKLNTRAAIANASRDVDEWIFSTDIAGGRVWKDEIEELEAVMDINVRHKKAILSPVEEAKTITGRQHRVKALNVMEEDLARLESSRLKDHGLARNVRAQVEMLNDWDNQALDVLDPKQRALVEGRDEEFVVSTKEAIASAIDAKAEASREIRKLKFLRKWEKNAAGLERRVAAEEARLGSQLENVDWWREEGRRARQAIGFGQDTAENRAIVETAQEIEDFANDKLNLEVIKNRINQGDLDKRIADLEAVAKQHDATIQTEKASLKSEKAREKLRKQYEAEGRRLRKERFDDLRKKEDALRQGVRESLDRVKRDYEEFRNAVWGQGAEKKKGLKALAKDATKKGQQTENFDELFSMWRTFKEKGASAIEELARRDPELFAKFTDKFRDIRVVTISDENYELFLDPRKGLFSKLNKPDSLSRMLGLLDETTSFWKTLTLNPAFMATRARDVISNVVMQIQGGARPGKFQAVGNKFARAVDRFIETADEAVLDGALPADVMEMLGVTTGKEAFDLMYSKGVFSRNILMERYQVGVGEKVIDMTKDVPFDQIESFSGKVGEALTRASGMKHPVAGKFYKAGSRIAETLDADTRIGAFIDHLRQGKSVDEAAATVKKFGYDPRRVPLSNFERHALRRFIPFYTFAKTAIGMQMDALLTKPASVTWFKKVHDSLNAMRDKSEVEQEAMLPEFVESAFGIPMKVENGVARVWMFGSLMPVSVLGEFVNSVMASFDDESPDSAGRYIGKQLHPIIKTSIENIRNESFFTQRPVERFDGEKVEYMGVMMSPKMKSWIMNIRLANEIHNLGIFTPEDIKTSRIANSMSAKDLSVWERLAFNSSFSPAAPLLKRYDRAIEEEASYAIRGEQRKLSKYRSDLRSQLERQPSAELKADNIEAIKRLMAQRMARIELISKSLEKERR